MIIRDRVGKQDIGHVGLGKMLIKEMLENEDLISSTNEKLGYDLKDDLIFFMNNDPEFYREDYFPTVIKFKKYIESGKSVQPRAFESMIKHAYECYQKKFPVEGLDPELNKEISKNICEYIHETETRNIKEGHYD